MSCSTYKAIHIIASLFSAASFLGVVAINVDRFLAIWLFSTLLSLMALWVPFNIVSLMTYICGVVGLVLSTMAYIRIYLAVRRHKNQIQALQGQQIAF